MLKVCICLLILVFLAGTPSTSLAKSERPPIAFSNVVISVNNQVYGLEYAQTLEQRARGLMYRKSMCSDCGMLFNFNTSREVGMWMKNTYIPLDVAFIARDGTIVNIEQMQPHDLTSTFSQGQVLYAWEMNQGWFKKRNIKVGDKVQIAAK